MMKKPLISIIMAVRNNECYFPIAVESVLEQPFKEIELIIVDDGSIDNTGKIADRYALKDKRVKVIHQENQWIYASFNNGIKAAKGKYIFIVNSDDKLVDNALEYIAENIYRYNYPDVLYTGIYFVKCDDNQKSLHSPNETTGVDKTVYVKELKKNPDMIMELFKSNCLQDQANIYKRELMIQEPFRNDFYSADTYFNYKFIRRITSFIALEKPVYLHYIYDNKNMNVANKKYYGYEHYMYDELYKAALEMLEFFNINTTSNVKKFINKRKTHFSITVRALLNDDSYKALDDRLDEVFLFSYDKGLKKYFEFDSTEEEGREEYEARILSELRNYFCIEDVSTEHFSYDLVESLLRYEHDKWDIEKIHLAVYNSKNPFKIGKCFYEKLLGCSKPKP